MWKNESWLIYSSEEAFLLQAILWRSRRWKGIKQNFSWDGQNKINSYSQDEVEKAQWKSFSPSPEAAWSLWRFVRSCYLRTHLLVPSCTKGCVWCWCFDSDSSEPWWGEKPSPVQQDTGSPASWGKMTPQTVLKKMALPEWKRGYRAFLEEQRKGGRPELLLSGRVYLRQLQLWQEN